MKSWIVGACVAALAFTITPFDDAEAKKRFGGGQSSGMQRDMPTRNAPDAPAGKPATPQQGAQPGAPAAAAAPAAAGAAAAAGKRSWLGPIAGIAAAVGLVALFSSLGLGEELASFLMLALLALATIAIVFWAIRRFGNKGRGQPALATAGAPASASASGGFGAPASPAPLSVDRGMQPIERQTAGAFERNALGEPLARNAFGQPLAPLGSAAGEPAEALSASGAGRPIAYVKGDVPADFDTAGFERIARMIFIRMQAAHDAADLNDLKAFTTPELFASVAMDIQDRQGAAQHTEVEQVNAEVLDVATEDGRQVVSVRYHGMLREDDAASEAFDEVWHLVKPLDNSRGWAIAGIQQQPQTA
jgi:predicted lipid-binding transport protein (Tim44 family)